MMDLSSITQMELYYGAFNKREIHQLDKFLSDFYIYHLTPAISIKAVELIKIYSKSHNLNLPDALIAATAIIKQTPLITLNLKDFRYIDEVELIAIA
jgi:predicted nucleic acid-binding protein